MPALNKNLARRFHIANASQPPCGAFQDEAAKTMREKSRAIKKHIEIALGAPELAVD